MRRISLLLLSHTTLPSDSRWQMRKAMPARLSTAITWALARPLCPRAVGLHCKIVAPTFRSTQVGQERANADVTGHTRSVQLCLFAVLSYHDSGIQPSTQSIPIA